MEVSSPRTNHFHINISHYADRNGYRMKLVNTHGNTLFETKLTREEYEVDLDHKYLPGNIFLQILDQEGNIMDIVKVH